MLCGVPGSREAHTFLKKLGVGGRLQQSLVARYGGATEARLREDPYSALFPISGLSFRRAPLLPTLRKPLCLTCVWGNSLHASLAWSRAHPHAWPAGPFVPPGWEAMHALGHVCTAVRALQNGVWDACAGWWRPWRGRWGRPRTCPRVEAWHCCTRSSWPQRHAVTRTYRGTPWRSRHSGSCLARARAPRFPGSSVHVFKPASHLLLFNVKHLISLWTGPGPSLGHG